MSSVLENNQHGEALSKKIRIRLKRGWIAYPGSTVQQNYAEDQVHGFLTWSINSRNDFDVKFCELPNPCPFVTVPWVSNVDATLDNVKKTCPPGGRFRVYSTDHISQREMIDLSSRLKETMQAVEVTYKSDKQVNHDVVVAGATTLAKGDLRNTDVLVKLLKEHNDSTADESTWATVQDLVKGYVSRCSLDDSARNTTWSLRHLKFDNTLAYGEGNVINFEKLNGIVGIFGPNRSGKSSIVGTIMYGLFNGTDRGSIKNLHVINTRKPYCYSRAVINVNGVDYVIERQTVKIENKRGQLNSSTALNVFRMENGEAVDLAGEQRLDTEKVIRKLIGNADDFLLTSLSAQDEIKLFISHGSTKRKQILSRFLDLDVFDQMYDLVKNDLNVTKAELRVLPDRDWDAADADAREKITLCDNEIAKKNAQVIDVNDRLSTLKRKAEQHQGFAAVTPEQLEAQRSVVKGLDSQVNNTLKQLAACEEKLASLVAKSQKIEGLQKEYDVDDLKRRFVAFRELEMSVIALRHAHEREQAELLQQERSLKILDEVPCGDSFPTCKFIKNAHQSKGKVEPQKKRLEEAQENLRAAEEALTTLKEENLAEKIEKAELHAGVYLRLQMEISQVRLELVKLDASAKDLNAQRVPARRQLEMLELAAKNSENVELVALKAEIDSLQNDLKRLDSEKLNFASERGRIQVVLDRHTQERQLRAKTVSKMQAFEMIASSFSRKGIPSVIIRSQLPVINAEIARILNGMFDFTVELENDDESDATEVYINYGDSRRIIELGSGMEKMVASVAIRAALINVSSLPKTNMFIIDEGFGALDDSGVEACNRLLAALKRYFKAVIVITHVEGVKDAADLVVEVTKNEKDAKVTYV